MSNHQTPQHSPTARCKTYAALLPLLDESDTDPTALAEAQAHLATCAYCQQQRAAYRQLEVAALHYLGPPNPPRYQTDQIMRDLLAEPAAWPIETTQAKPLSALPAPRKPRSVRRFVAGLAPLAAVLITVVLVVTLFAKHPGPLATFTPTPIPQDGSDTELLDVAMVSATEGWAVGYSIQVVPVDTAQPGVGTADFSNETAVLMHYVRGTWTSAHLSIHGRLTSIEMLSPTDGWAIGFQDSTINGIFLHYDGHTWKQFPAGPMSGFGFNRLQMLSDTDGWATGGPVAHFDGKTWTAQPIPASLKPETNYVLMQSVSMTSPTEGWAVGFLQELLLPGTPSPDTETVTGIILRYLSGQWAVYRTIPNANLKDIEMTSPDEGWIVGRTEVGSHWSPLLLHYMHGALTEVPNPLSASDSENLAFERVQMRTASDGWIIIGSGINFHKSATLRYDGSQWQVARLPINLNFEYGGIFSISMVSADDGWAVGAYPYTANTTSTSQCREQLAYSCPIAAALPQCCVECLRHLT